MEIQSVVGSLSAALIGNIINKNNNITEEKQEAGIISGAMDKVTISPEAKAASAA